MPRKVAPTDDSTGSWVFALKFLPSGAYQPIQALLAARERVNTPVTTTFARKTCLCCARAVVEYVPLFLAMFVEVRRPMGKNTLEACELLRLVAVRKRKRADWLFSFSVIMFAPIKTRQRCIKLPIKKVRHRWLVAPPVAQTSSRG